MGGHERGVATAAQTRPVRGIQRRQLRRHPGGALLESVFPAGVRRDQRAGDRECDLLHQDGIEPDVRIGRQPSFHGGAEVNAPRDLDDPAGRLPSRLFHLWLESQVSEDQDHVRVVDLSDLAS